MKTLKASFVAHPLHTSGGSLCGQYCPQLFKASPSGGPPLPAGRSSECLGSQASPPAHWTVILQLDDALEIQLAGTMSHLFPRSKPLAEVTSIQQIPNTTNCNSIITTKRKLKIIQEQDNALQDHKNTYITVNTIFTFKQ